MAKGIGRILQIGIGKETTRGTAAAAAFWIPFQEFDINEKFENALDNASVGVIEDSVGQTRVKDWAEGSLKAPIGDKHIGLIFLAAFGGISTSGPTDSAYTHTYSVGQSAQHQSLTIGIDDSLGGQDYQHALGVVTGLELNYELGKILEYAVTFKAKKGATASLTPATTAENKFVHKHFVFKLAATQAGLGAASAQNIRQLTLKIEKNVEDDLILGATAPADFLNKQFSINGTVEAIWQNESDFKTFTLAGTQKAMRIDLINTDVIIGSATNPMVRIDLHKVIFTEITRPVKINDVMVQTLSFRAHYNTTDSKMVTPSIVNAQSSY